jgi:hypothetical protein
MKQRVAARMAATRGKIILAELGAAVGNFLLVKRRGILLSTLFSQKERARSLLKRERALKF